MKTILMTGAAGSVASLLRPELCDRYKLRLSDIKPVKKLGRGETFVRGDIESLSDMLRITKGVDAIIHLGAMRWEAPWKDILQANIIGCYNLFEAARRNGVKRVVFASSNHATGFYRRDETIDHHVYPKPDTRYCVSKVFGEQLGRLYADKYGMEVFCIRIGSATVAPLDKRRLSVWVSPRDLAQLVEIGVEHRDIRFEIVYGVSNNKRSWYDNSNARRFGYRPKDNAENYAKEILAKEKPSDDERAEIYQGGAFVSAEAGDAPARQSSKTSKRKTKK